MNIDVEQVKIDAFDLARRRDTNVACAISDQEGNVTLFKDRYFSLGSTIDPDTANLMAAQGTLEQVSVPARTLDSVLRDTPYSNQEIDLLTIDCEGHDLNVIHSIDLRIYRPKIILVETHKKEINAVVNSAVHQFMEAEGYSLFNWVGLTAFYHRVDFAI